MTVFMMGYTSETGKNLADAIEKRYPLRRVGEEETKVNPEPNDILFRWGSTRNPEWDKKFSWIINPVSFIQFSCNKKRILQICARKGVPAPEIIEKVKNKGEYPLLGRRIYHKEGRDIIVVKNKEERLAAKEKCDYFTKYLPNVREYRVHVAKGDIIRVQSKYHRRRREETREVVLRNYHLGFRFQDLPRAHFSTRQVEWQKLCALSQRLHDKVIGEEPSNHLFLYAMDIIMVASKKEEYPVFLETNCAPYLSATGIDRYVQRISWFVDKVSASPHLGKPWQHLWKMIGRNLHGTQ